jgi:hypothetical protein
MNFEFVAWKVAMLMLTSPRYAKLRLIVKDLRHFDDHFWGRTRHGTNDFRELSWPCPRGSVSG